MKKNKQWFALMTILLFTTIFTMIFLVLISFSHSIKQSHYKAYKKVQASNYAVEWMEMVKGYYLTELNKDKINSWDDHIQPLSGMYKISFNWEYILDSVGEEIIEVDEPYLVDYTRTIEITEWDSIDEKKITVTVDYQETNKVSFETSLVNLYWK